jgi:hypothetical protein
MLYKITILLFSIIAFSSVCAGADNQPIVIGFDGKPDSDGVPKGWELKVKSGDAIFKILDENNQKIIYLKSADASFSFQKSISLNPREYPYLTWTWKAVKLPAGGDFRKSKTNDQALQVFVAFKGGDAFSYIWDTNAPEGSFGEESIGWPINIKIKVIAVKSGSSQLGQWVTINRNIYDDYKKFFGKEPPELKGIRVQANSQHTGATGEGYFNKIVFSSSEPPKEKNR